LEGDFIRGVSGGERKRVAIAEVVLSGVCFSVGTTVRFGYGFGVRQDVGVEYQVY